MALLSMGGTSMVERCGRASTRPVASSVGRCSTSLTGFAPESSWASASSTDNRPLFMQLQMRKDEHRNGAVVVQVEHRQPGLDLAVAGHRDDVRIVGMQQRL